MRKVFLFSLCFSSLLFANQDISLSKDFMDRYNEYKTNIISKNAKALYEMNLPIFRFLNSYKSYSVYIKNYLIAQDINISKVLEKTDEKVVLINSIKAKNKENMVYLKQEWYKFKGKYYIMTSDPFIFVNCK